MNNIKVGTAAPDFELPATGEKNISLSQFTGNKHVVLYFYPRDNTSGCTKESQAFRDHYDEFAQLDTVILGISRDSIKSHENFKTKQTLPFDLLSDKEEMLCTLFDVMKMKNMYGKQAKGIERSTFLIDKQGFLRHEWRKVKVAEHVEAVLSALRAL